MNSIAVWPVKLVRVKDLIPHQRNPRKIEPERLEVLKANIVRQGFRTPLCADENGVLLAGHQRMKALIDLGLGELQVPVSYAPQPLTEALRKEILAADNLSFGEWDYMILNEDYTVDELKTYGFQEEFFTEDDTAPDELPDQDEEPTIPTVPRTKPGDVYQIGSHRLVCGSATSPHDMATLMDGAKADLLLTDPPYNVNYEGKTKEALKIQNDQMTNDVFREFLRDAFSVAVSAMRPGASFYIWHADSEGYNFRGACFDVGLRIRQCLIWVKNTIVLGRQDYHWKHEPCLYGWVEGAAHTWASDRKQATVLNFDKPTRNGEHPTMKPVALMEYQIRNNTHPRENVLDSFGGSGTTMIAAQKLQRQCFMLELDPIYCDVIVTRMLHLFPGLEVKLNGEVIAW